MRNKIKMAAIMLMIACFFGCTKHDVTNNGTPNDNGNSNNNGNNNDQTEITIDEIAGIWQLQSDNFCFISINPNKEYSLMLPTINGHAMSTGTLRLKGDLLILNCYWTSDDTLKVEHNENELHISGKIKPLTNHLNNTASELVDCYLQKTDETFLQNELGTAFWYQYSGHGFVQEKETFGYDSKITATYSHYKRNNQYSQFILDDYQCFNYFYRHPYTYVHNIDSDRTIGVYDFVNAVHTEPCYVWCVGRYFE